MDKSTVDEIIASALCGEFAANARPSTDELAPAVGVAGDPEVCFCPAGYLFSHNSHAYVDSFRVYPALNVVREDLNCMFKLGVNGTTRLLSGGLASWDKRHMYDYLASKIKSTDATLAAFRNYYSLLPYAMLSSGDGIAEFAGLTFTSIPPELEKINDNPGGPNDFDIDEPLLEKTSPFGYLRHMSYRDIVSLRKISLTLSIDNSNSNDDGEEFTVGSFTVAEDACGYLNSNCVANREIGTEAPGYCRVWISEESGDDSGHVIFSESKRKEKYSMEEPLSKRSVRTTLDVVYLKKGVTYLVKAVQKNYTIRFLDPSKALSFMAFSCGSPVKRGRGFYYDANRGYLQDPNDSL